MPAKPEEMAVNEQAGSSPRVRNQFRSERQEAIVRMVFTTGRAEVADLASHFLVNPETIRRDLSDLEKKQVVTRVHGGAVPYQLTRHEPQLSVRNTHNLDQKRRIGQAAAVELRPDSSVLIDSGSTTLMFCSAFPRDIAITVFTNSLLAAQALSDRENIDLVLLGGAVKKNTLAVIDLECVALLSQLHVDAAFIGCDGITVHDGMTTPYRPEALIKRAMMDAARRTVLLADHSKFGDVFMSTIAPISKLDAIYTDTWVPDNIVDAFEVVGPEVVRV